MISQLFLTGSRTNVVVDDYCECDSSVVLYRKQSYLMLLLMIILNKQEAEHEVVAGEKFRERFPYIR